MSKDRYQTYNETVEPKKPGNPNLRFDVAQALLLKKMELPRHANDVISHLINEAIAQADEFVTTAEKTWGTI